MVAINNRNYVQALLDSGLRFVLALDFGPKESRFGRVSLYAFSFFGLRVKCAAMNFNSTTLAQGAGKIQDTRNATDAA